MLNMQHIILISTRGMVLHALHAIDLDTVNNKPDTMQELD